MALTRIKTDNILDRQVFDKDLADGAVTFNKIAGLAGGAAGHALKTDGAGNLYWELPTGASSSLDTLIDVDVTTVAPMNGDSLVYNSVSMQWEPGSNVPSSLSLNSLIDTDLSSPYVSNQFLRFNGTKWINDFVSAAYVQGLTLVGITGLLGDLANVNVAGATAGQRLSFDGTQWRAVDAATLTSIDAFLDVDTTTVPPVGGDALVWNGLNLQWEPLSVGLGASSNTYVVADITARDALTAAEGDQAFVRSGATTGEWELYLWDAAWILIATQDSASTDAKTIEAIVVPATISPVLLGNVSPDSRVTVVTIEVTVAFDGAPTLTVGDSANNSRLIDDMLHDLSETGTYTTTTDYVYGGASDTDINGYFSAGGATTGSARILVTYV